MYYILTVIISLFFIICAQETTIVDLSEYGDITGIGYTSLEKQALRYGFQQTKECKNFAKAYMCVRKCKDFNYDVAHSDRLCKCACYMKVSKEKFTLSPVTNGTMWSIGAPTTTIFVTPKLPPTYEDEITSGPEDYDDKSEGDGDDKSDGENESEDHAAVQSGDGGDLKKSGAKETSGSNPEGDGLITIADGEDSKGDGDFEGGGDGTTAESGGEPTAED